MRRRNFLRRFWSDNRGNIAVLFTLSIIPIIGAVGAAVDYSLASAYRADLQKSLDATALALSKILPADQATLDTVGRQYFDASMGPNDLADLQVTVVAGTGTLTVTAMANYQPRLATIFGIGQFPIGAQAEARWGIGKVEVALVLDNSLSMNSLGRITALKEAAHDLLTILEDAAQNEGDAKVAIIPFDANVRVVPKASINTAWIDSNLDWIRWDLWMAEQSNYLCTISGKTSQSSCESSGVCSKTKYSTKTNCISNGGTWTTGVWNLRPKTDWNGCVEDRDKDPSVDYDVKDTAPVALETKFPAWQCWGSSGNFSGAANTALPTLMPLTTNWGTPSSTDTTTLHGKVASLTPSGYTNANIGLVWGFHALSPAARLTEGAAYDTENLAKIIILLSDGDNTRNRWWLCNPLDPCPTTTADLLNARTTAVCTNIKAAGIKIYTIRLIDGNAALLQSCATSPSMYYEVTEASQLSAVFNAIGAEIANLHLAR